MHLADVDWLAVLRRTVGSAAIALAAAVVCVWVGNFALISQAAGAAGSESILAVLVVLGWLEIVSGVVVVLGMAVGWWFHRPLWAPGVASVILGMVVHWGWWWVDRTFDLFGTTGFNDPDPELVRRATIRMWVMLGADVLAVLLLVLGGVLLIRHRAAVDATHGSDAADAGADRIAAARRAH